VFSWARFGGSILRSAIFAALAVIAAIVGRSCFDSPRGGARELLVDPATSGIVLFIVSFVTAIVAVVTLFRALFASYRAECPDCGREIDAIGGAAFFPCEQCKRFLRSEAMRLHHVDDDYVHHEPVFFGKLPDHATFPERCCVCMERPTRTLRHEWKWSTAPRSGERVPVEHRRSVEVPYCDEHRDGVSVLEGAGAPATISFRSYAYLRAFERDVDAARSAS
jgi:hypothetical protein